MVTKKAVRVGGIVLFCGLTGTVFATLHGWSVGFFPFSRVYRPKLWPFFLIFCACYLCFTFLFVVADSPWCQRVSFPVFLAHCGGVVFSCGVFCLYHALHPGQRRIFVFKSLEVVTPYHVQLGQVFFPTVFLASLLLLVNWRRASNRAKTNRTITSNPKKR